MIPHIREVQIRNYKSIGQAVVQLNPFTLLVGPNGSGKSNFVDSLAFVQQCLSDSIELAFEARGGSGSVRRLSGGHPTQIGIRLQIALSSTASADYSFEIATGPAERIRVVYERCVVEESSGDSFRFSVDHGQFVEEIRGIRPRVAPDRLALYAASAIEEFRGVFDFLSSMRLYSIIPESLRELHQPDPGVTLKVNGSNAAAVLKRLRAEDAAGYERVCSLLSKVVQGVESVDYSPYGEPVMFETLQFKQDIGLPEPWALNARFMSDGTLRMLGILLAVYQSGTSSLIAIEEPEATVHPAVAEIITSVLMDASKRVQILATTHSPDILDHKDLDDDQIRVVTKQRGRTVIAPIAGSSRSAIRQHLYTAGELLRINELNPDLEFAEAANRQLSLFGTASAPEQGEE